MPIFPFLPKSSIYFLYAQRITQLLCNVGLPTTCELDILVFDAETKRNENELLTQQLKGQRYEHRV